MEEVKIVSRLDMLKMLHNELQDKVLRQELDYQLFTSLLLTATGNQNNVYMQERTQRAENLKGLRAALRACDDMIKKEEVEAGSSVVETTGTVNSIQLPTKN